MTLIETSTGRPRAFSDVLVMLAGRRGEKLSLGEVVDAFGDRAFGPVMLFFALLNMLPWPPGGTTIVGFPLVLLSMELAWGRDTLWIPRWLERISVNRTLFQKLSLKLLKPLRFTENLSRPRLPLLTCGLGQSLVGLACLFLSIVLVLPVWGANLIPAAAIGFFALGVTQRDGVAVLIGWLGAAVTVVILFVAWRIIIAAVEGALRWTEHLF